MSIIQYLDLKPSHYQTSDIYWSKQVTSKPYNLVSQYILLYIFFFQIIPNGINCELSQYLGTIPILQVIKIGYEPLIKTLNNTMVKKLRRLKGKMKHKTAQGIKQKNTSHTKKGKGKTRITKRYL